MRYTSRGLRRRRNTDQWEVALSHKDPITGEPTTTYHTITAKTERQAQKRRDELIRELEDKGAAVASRMTLGEFTDEFIRYKEEGKAVEKSTVNDYRKEARVLKRYLGDVRLADVTIVVVGDWMARMTAEGYAPRTVAKPFALLKQVMKHAMALDLVTKNPCQFCKPPKQQRKVVNTLCRSERTRMMELARAAEPAPLAFALSAISLASFRNHPAAEGGEPCDPILARRSWGTREGRGPGPRTTRSDGANPFPACHDAPMRRGEMRPSPAPWPPDGRSDSHSNGYRPLGRPTSGMAPGVPDGPEPRSCDVGGSASPVARSGVLSMVSGAVSTAAPFRHAGNGSAAAQRRAPSDGAYPARNETEQNAAPS